MGNETEKIEDLLFGVRRSIRYHHRRRRFFDQIHKISTFLSVLSGSATIAVVLAECPRAWVITFAALVAIFSIIDLVVGTSQAARLHNDLAKRFINLEKYIIAEKTHTNDNLLKFTAQRLDIESDEPPALKVLDSICHNELLRAMDYDETEFVNIKWYQRLFAHFFDIHEYKIYTTGRKY